SGRGPTKLISPLIILINWGISSKEDFLRNVPNFVTLSSSGNNFPFSSVLSVIVLNFMIWKIFSFFPGLGCKNNGLPLFTNNRINQITRKKGIRTIKPIRERVKSINLLKIILYMV